MRRRAVLAAALVTALAIAAAGCKPSSLTPFGIGRRGPDDPGDTINGLWQGVTDSGGPLEFSVVSEEVTGLSFVTNAPGCINRRWVIQNATALVRDGAFTLEAQHTTAGRLVFEGTFSSNDAVSGSFFFEGLPAAPPCPSSFSGTYVAGRVR